MTMTVDRPADAERVLSRELEQELLKYPGEWVAMTHEKVIAHGLSAVTVHAEALKLGYDDPILYRVPEPGSAYFF